MPRRTYAEIFLDTLEELSGDEPRLVGNKTLRNALGWDAERYEWIRSQLYEEGLVIIGRGKGGSVGLAVAPGSEALQLFISYSHVDAQLKAELVKHLEPLRRLKLIEAWSDTALRPGDEWEEEISERLEEADIILLLISIDFINSNFCYDVELERALERHKDGAARVIPVILRSCHWQQTPFAKLQALPKEAKAVCSWLDRDEAFTDIAEGIRKVAEELRDAEA
ncbi:toll/interleukin-1 receptor domain-containing protein [Sinimarinibacterium flocculans]|uniref:toll/interleukin-1 receptor domain-containing protein n=1 Tax=Sinimarinibacterium flocculans TaxID=985250 RepID=UPI0024935C5C|nr:toll/interleukin-1 receptor domain-containing protein [Sinimarinibacterium flocculans]